MPPSSFWGRACASSSSEGAGHLINKLQICAALLIVAFSVSALASGWLHVKWRLLSDFARGKVWRVYGPFTGLMCAGSVFGCITWVSNMKFLTYRIHILLYNASSINSTAFFSDPDSLAPVLDSAPAALRWHGVFFIMYATPFLQAMRVTFCACTVWKSLVSALSSS
jgi:hypothetical protein